MQARIFRMAKSSTQSGTGRTQDWVLAFAMPEHQRPDPLMGWIGGGDTQNQVSLRFDSQEEAVAYAQANGIAYAVEIPPSRVIRPKAYADNFKFGRVENWTH